MKTPKIHQNLVKNPKRCNRCGRTNLGCQIARVSLHIAITDCCLDKQKLNQDEIPQFLTLRNVPPGLKMKESS